MQKGTAYKLVHEVFSSTAESAVNALAADGWVAIPAGFGFNPDQHYFVWMQKGMTFDHVHEVYSSTTETAVNTLAGQGFVPVGFGFNPDEHYFVWVTRPCSP
jgi:hypothetical protein